MHILPVTDNYATWTGAMIEDNNLDEMFDQTMAQAHTLSLQKQDCLFASLYPTLLSGAKCLIIP